MSYPLDLDEYTETRLRIELQRRVDARATGLCDYCGRAPTTSPCKFPDRHNAAPPAATPAESAPRETPRCPICQNPLQPVRYPGGYMNEDQWDSTKAGDWFCDKADDAHKAHQRGANKANAYFWQSELRAAPVSEEPVPPAQTAAAGSPITKEITTPEEHQALLAEVEKLLDMHPEEGTPEANRLGLLAALVHHYEQQKFPLHLHEECALIAALLDRAYLTLSEDGELCFGIVGPECDATSGDDLQRVAPYLTADECAHILGTIPKAKGTARSRSALLGFLRALAPVEQQPSAATTGSEEAVSDIISVLRRSNGDVVQCFDKRLSPETQRGLIDMYNIGGIDSDHRVEEYMRVAPSGAPVTEKEIREFLSAEEPCWECNGAQRDASGEPCKVCRATGKMPPAPRWAYKSADSFLPHSSPPTIDAMPVSPSSDLKLEYPAGLAAGPAKPKTGLAVKFSLSFDEVDGYAARKRIFADGSVPLDLCRLAAQMVAFIDPSPEYPHYSVLISGEFTNGGSTATVVVTRARVHVPI